MSPLWLGRSLDFLLLYPGMAGTPATLEPLGQENYNYFSVQKIAPKACPFFVDTTLPFVCPLQSITCRKI